MIRKRNRRDSLPVNAEINLTNLIDIAFVLLIIFMITAPMLQGGVTLELPKGDVTPLESANQIVVSFTKDGGVFIDKTPVTMADLGAQIKRLSAGGKSVALRADKDVPWGVVGPGMSVMHNAGVTDFGLMLEQLQKDR